ncbi:RNA chaperone Hfq [Caballeronia cordobensis]|uniref:RNA chaperone Hfq n=1 Tax=Caballeronia cordobensis TaxID=1353886 RepID=UPI003908A7EC
MLRFTNLIRTLSMDSRGHLLNSSATGTIVKQATIEVQSDFLAALVANRAAAWIFLVNGIKLRGVIASFDKYLLALQSPPGNQIVYKNAVSTVIEQNASPVGRHGSRPTGHGELRTDHQQSGGTTRFCLSQLAMVRPLSAAFAGSHRLASSPTSGFSRRSASSRLR